LGWYERFPSKKERIAHEKTRSHLSAKRLAGKFFMTARALCIGQARDGEDGCRAHVWGQAAGGRHGDEVAGAGSWAAQQRPAGLYQQVFGAVALPALFLL
jgi:hypothetical protein